MILETSIEIPALAAQGACGTSGSMAIIVALVGLVVGFLVAAIRHGPLAAGDMTYRVLSAAAVDLVHMAPRRMCAIARLAIQEAIRRRVWVVFVLFALVLVFAGWFLDPNSQDPAKLYLDFVLWWTNLLVLFLAIFLSTFSLPNEIKNRIIYTVVTKPVRSGEIVLGRMVGFTAIGTRHPGGDGPCELRVRDAFAAARAPDRGRGYRKRRLRPTTIDQDHPHDFRLKPEGEKLDRIQTRQRASSPDHRRRARWRDGLSRRPARRPGDRSRSDSGSGMGRRWAKDRTST